MGKNKGKQVKRTIKYLALCKNPEIISRIISDSPENVIKAICNAAVNTAHGNVELKKWQKRILSSNRELIERLVQKGESASQKRKVLKQTGGHVLRVIIPTILGAVISSLGLDLLPNNGPNWRQIRVTY